MKFKTCALAALAGVLMLLPGSNAVAQRHRPPPLYAKICSARHDRCWFDNVHHAPPPAYGCRREGGTPVFYRYNRHEPPRYDHCEYPHRRHHGPPPPPPPPRRW